MEFVYGMIFAFTVSFLMFFFIVKEMRGDCDHWYNSSQRWMNAYFEMRDNVNRDI